MRAAAAAALKALTGPQRELAARPFAADAARRWLEYRPLPRPGACIADMSTEARKAAHRLLATGLSEHAYAKAMVIMALEEVLDRRERWQYGRHSNDYWVSIFGDPSGDDPWSWRFEGHHLSVTMTVLGDEVSPAPVFLGANPACVSYGSQAVSRPLALEEDLAREVLTALDPAQRSVAVASDRAPADLHTATSPRAAERIAPLGSAASRVGPGPRAALGRTGALYLDRIPARLAAREAARVAAGELYFAWQGPTTPGGGPYSQVPGADALTEHGDTR